MLVICASLLGRTYIPYLLLGLVNRVARPFASIFVFYAGSPRYRSHYAYQSVDWMFRWSPTPVGLVKQGGKLGLVFGVSMAERDFLSRSNEANLIRFQKRVRRIAKLLDVQTINMAGILPSVLSQRGADFVADPRGATTQAIGEALRKLIDEEFAGAPVPVILLGGNGYIGKAVQARANELGLSFIVVDPKDGLTAMPDELRDQPAILVDVARRGVLGKYVDQLWPGLIVLNETFPEPSRGLIRKLEEKGVRLFHLAGVEGTMMPPLPFAYAGAVPCCAVHDLSMPLVPKLLPLSAS